MIYFTKQLIKDKNEFTNSIKKEINLIAIFMHNQKYKENLLEDTLKKISSPSYIVNSEDQDALNTALESYKKSLDLSKENISSLTKLSSFLESTKLMKDEELLEKINDFNKKIYDINNIIFKNNTEILNTLELSIPKAIVCEIISTNGTKKEDPVNDSSAETPLFASDNSTNMESISEKISHENPFPSTAVKSTSKSDTTSTTASTVSNQFKENTLIISEKTKKVFLPYNLNCIEELFKNNPSRYSSVENVIEKEYTLPLSQFKMPSFSRFREAYKLVRNKEFGSVKESLDLATELFFNYNLHPAIISACRNLDELDIYLNYLAENETEKFNCFNIEYEALPSFEKNLGKHKMN